MSCGNEMNRALGHLCAHIGQTGPGEPPEDGEMIGMTQDPKFGPWRSEAEHATSRSRKLPIILTSTRGWGRNIFCFLQTAETGNRTPNSGVKGSGANRYPRATARELWYIHSVDIVSTCVIDIHLCYRNLQQSHRQHFTVRKTNT